MDSFLNGKLEEARKYYEEMKEKGFLRNQKAEEMLQALSLYRVTITGTLDFNNQTGLDSLKKNPKVVLNTPSYEKDFQTTKPKDYGRRVSLFGEVGSSSIS
ncbi:hypothetical protein IFM89_000870 [Coptis chinensis]|uniref:Pentatricopeptide repeat-containing protein n=1 Tax=Coptis chinensis TaxID=261450 RepID=A0A835M3Y2_9MAGN|nr:hypothetical protein IFM89_000870 [Coptis chinensis]